MKSTFLRTLGAFLLAACLAAAPAFGQAQPDTVARLSDLVIQALPAGDLFQTYIDRDERWPLNEKASRVEPGQLACLRQRLSSEGFREKRMEETAAFAKRFPERVEGSIRVLEGGAAEMFAASIQAGADQARTGRKADFNELTSRFTPTQLGAMVELTSDEKHRSLRELIGIDDALGIEHSGEQNQARGRNKGMLLGVKLMLAAMEHCKVPLAALH